MLNTPGTYAYTESPETSVLTQYAISFALSDVSYAADESVVLVVVTLSMTSRWFNVTGIGVEPGADDVILISHPGRVLLPSEKNVNSK